MTQKGSGVGGKSKDPGSDLSSTACRLCDLGHISEPLCAAVSSSER